LLMAASQGQVLISYREGWAILVSSDGMWLRSNSWC
jgi:hypothetical protein